MAILSKSQLCSLDPIQPSKPVVICCSDLDMLKHTKITPAINDRSLWNVGGVCQPSYIVIYFGYKSRAYRIEIIASGICYSTHEDTCYDWRIDVWEMNNQEVNRFGSFLQSPEVPINYAYYLLLEKVIEIEDFYE